MIPTMDMIGEKFPKFSLQDQSEKTWTQVDFTGQWTILYAYPKDMTSGCTIEAHDFTENLKAFQKAGAQVLGISPDDIKRHNKFCKKDGISFPLLADIEKELLGKLGIWIEKSMYEKKYMGVNRSTWIIDESGKIAKEWRKVKVPGHVLAALEELKDLIA
jgi:peroxiredoxin Q/BCP